MLLFCLFVVVVFFFFFKWKQNLLHYMCNEKRIAVHYVNCGHDAKCSAPICRVERNILLQAVVARK